MLSKNFVLAGRASFIVENAKGENVTVKVSKSRPNSKYPTPVYFVSLRHNNDAWAYAGLLTPRFGIKIGFKTRATERARKIAEWALKIIDTGAAVPQGYRLAHTGRCGKCGKLLRDAESIALGLGPVCRG
jgi:hypothetical protein